MSVSETVTKPKYREVITSNIPLILKTCKHWVNWRAKLVEGTNGKPGRWAKVPCQPNGLNASVTNPAHWSSFPEVIAASEKGGFTGY